jgi:hypothetical protein
MLRNIIIAYLVALIPVIYILFILPVSVNYPFYINASGSIVSGKFTLLQPDTTKAIYLQNVPLKYTLLSPGSIQFANTSYQVHGGQTICLQQHTNIFQKIVHSLNN